MKIDDIVKGTVTGIQEYGVFVKVDEYDGLVHISEISEKFVRNVGDYLKVGDVVNLKVIELDEENKKLKLSYKAIKDKKINRHFKLGFQSLENKLPKWTETKLKEIDNNE